MCNECDNLCRTLCSKVYYYRNVSEIDGEELTIEEKHFPNFLFDDMAALEILFHTKKKSIWRN